MARDKRLVFRVSDSEKEFIERAGREADDEGEVGKWARKYLLRGSEKVLGEVFDGGSDEELNIPDIVTQKEEKVSEDAVKTIPDKVVKVNPKKNVVEKEKEDKLAKKFDMEKLKRRKPLVEGDDDYDPAKEEFPYPMEYEKTVFEGGEKVLDQGRYVRRMDAVFFNFGGISYEFVLEEGITVALLKVGKKWWSITDVNGTWGSKGDIKAVERKLEKK